MREPLFFFFTMGANAEFAINFQSSFGMFYFILFYFFLEIVFILGRYNLANFSCTQANKSCVI